MAFTQTNPGPPERSGGPLVEANNHLQRTLVIGLGGTGCEVIKRLKRRLSRQGQASTCIRFLSLDTDVRSWLATLQFPALEPRERVSLSYANPENVLEAPQLYPTIQHLFHQGRKVDIALLADANGAGLMPVVGRVAFHLNASHIYTQLQKARHDLQSIPTQPGGQPLTDEFRIYIIGSAAGGTGAGSFLEMAVLVRHVFQANCNIIGLLALPEAFASTLRGQQLDSQSRGNAYAVLKELQHLQDGSAYWEEPESYTFRYQVNGSTIPVTLNRPPFNILYMIDKQNQEGGALRNLTDIYEMAAQQLWVEIGSPFGAKFVSAQANDRATKNLANCPETGRPANISSLATAALVIPEEKLTRYCVRRYLRDVVRERLLGAVGDLREAEQAARAWLTAAKLEERGGHRMVSRALLTEPMEGREITGGEFALDPEGLIDKSAAEFLAALGNQEDHVTARLLPEVRAMVETNLEQLRKALPARISALLEDAASARGVRGALVTRAAVDRELAAMAAELAGRQEEDEAAREEASARLESQREALAKKGGMLGSLFGKRRELMRLIGRLQADVMQVEIDLLARAATLRLLEAARTLLEEHRRKLETLQGHLERIQQTADAELTQEQWAADSGSAYALETEVIRAERYGDYYERFRPGSPELFVKQLGGDGLLPVLTGLDYGPVAQLLTRTAWELFQERVRHLNVVEVLQDLYSKREIFDLLDDLARRCQPFWTATPRGSGAFSDVFLIGSPGVRPAGDGGPVQAEQLLQEWTDLHAGGGSVGIHSSPTYVALGAPGAIVFSRQTHGARLHYMRQVLEYQEHYRALQQQRGYPLHFKPCLEALPELRPDDDRATEFWALAVAYGMAAARTSGWYWALDTDQRRDPDDPTSFRSVEVLRAGSLWDLAAEIAPVESREMPAHSSRFLHATRSGALGQFTQRRECVAAAERMVERRLGAIGKQGLVAELGRYMEEILSPRMRRAEDLEASTLTREHAAIRRFLGRLNL
jgi:hypothetical protein